MNKAQLQRAVDTEKLWARRARALAVVRGVACIIEGK
jgi:hypothetical protein